MGLVTLMICELAKDLFWQYEFYYNVKLLNIHMKYDLWLFYIIMLWSSDFYKNAHIQVDVYVCIKWAIEILIMCSNIGRIPLFNNRDC